MPYSKEFKRDLNKLYLASGDYEVVLEKLCKKHPEDRKQGKLKLGDPRAIRVLQQLKSKMIQKGIWREPTEEPVPQKEAPTKEQMTLSVISLRNDGEKWKDIPGILQAMPMYAGIKIPGVCTLQKMLKAHAGGGTTKTGELVLLVGGNVIPLTSSVPKMMKALRVALEQGSDVTVQPKRSAGVASIIEEIF